MAAVENYSALDIGRVVQRTFQVLGRNAAPFLGLAVLFVGLPAIVIDLVNLGHPTTPLASAFSPAKIVSGIALFVVQFFLTILLQACIVIASVADLKGTRPSIVDALRQTMKFILPTSAITILAGLGIGFASLLLFVPGIILATMWVVVIPAAVVEKTGVFGAFRRSDDLTRGNRWRLFGLFAVYFIVAMIIQFSALAIVGFGVRSGGVAAMSLPVMAVGFVFGVIGSLVGAVGVSAIYFELRAAGEGMDLDDLAAVFA